ncbi:hypothetical protein [Azoarcus sp. DN11]|uniref:hypothetical protein n=1 Tax=Azoarcus sp. DN11 TaxID=356837 RepID=UPI0013E36F49|nr:hypothetical protein [Azoarcus sp. DN11]
MSSRRYLAPLPAATLCAAAATLQPYGVVDERDDGEGTWMHRMPRVPSSGAALAESFAGQMRPRQAFRRRFGGRQ